MITQVECIALDGKYETDDYQVTIKLVSGKGHYQLFAWDGLEWSDEKGLNRVYTNENSQMQYDDFIQRLLELEKSRMLYEVAHEIEEDQSYYFEHERIYLYKERQED